MATYTLDEVMAEAGPKTYSLEEVLQPNGAPTKRLTRTDKYVKGLLDPLVGIGQLTQHAIGPELQAKSANEMNAMGAPMGLSVQPGQLDQQIANDEQQYQINRSAAGETGIDGYRLLGNIVNPLTLNPSAKIPQAASTAGKIATGAAVGGAMGATQPVVSGGFDSEKRNQIAAGAVGGALVPAVIGGTSRIISPKASTNPNVATLKAEGVRPTIGQTLGGAWNRAEEKLMSVPLVGDLIGNARGMANSQFEEAVYNRALKPIGAKLPNGLSGREALSFTEETLGQKYDDVLTKIGAVKLDPSFNLKVSSLNNLAKNIKDDKAQKAYEMALETVKSNADSNGIMTSEAYKMVESELGTMARKLGSSDDVFMNKVAGAVKQLQDELRQTLERQAGPLSKELKSVNSAYAQFKRVQNAAAKIAADGGEFTPAQFQNAVKTMDRSKNKASFARGDALMQDLGDAGKSVLGGKVPNSGTADRLMLGLGAGSAAGYFIDPAIAAGVLGGAAMYSSPAQRLLTGMVSSRPDSAALTADFLRKNSQYLLPAGGVAGLGLLNQ